jgi:hypothetical protein
VRANRDREKVTAELNRATETVVCESARKSPERCRSKGGRLRQDVKMCCGTDYYSSTYMYLKKKNSSTYRSIRFIHSTYQKKIRITTPIVALISISISISTTYKRANLAGKLDLSRLSIFITRSKIVHSPHLARTPVPARAIPALITVPDFLALCVLLPRKDRI